MSKVFHCDVCNKSFKNSRSLSTHKYSYHSRNDDPFKAIEKSCSQLAQSFAFSPCTDLSGRTVQCPENSSDSDACSLTMRADNLRGKVNGLQFDSRDIERKLNNIQISLDKLDSEVGSNTRKMWNMKLILDRKIAADDNESDIKAKDLIDDVIEIENLLAENKVREVVSDILKLRRVIRNYILEELDLSNISDEEIDLLRNISNMGKAEARDFITDNFTNLADIFSSLQGASESDHESGSQDETEGECDDESDNHTSGMENASSACEDSDDESD